METKSEVSKRDKESREEILFSEIFRNEYNGDFFRVKSIIRYQSDLLSNNTEPKDKIERVLIEYPFIYAYEWEVKPGFSQYGKGDLIFSDANLNVLLMEVKELSPFSGRNQCVARTKTRKQVKMQTEKYMAAFKKLHPELKSIKGIAVAGNEWYFDFYNN